MVKPAHHWAQRPPAQREAIGFTALLGLALLGLGAVAKRNDLLSPLSIAVAVLVLVSGSALVLRGLPPGQQRYGAANRLTQARLAMAALLCALLIEASIGAGPHPSPLLAWSVVAYAGLAAALDAVDGPLARGQGLAGPFGARFDMEVDAFFILVLALLCWRWNKAGAWVVLAGALRYLFVAAAWVWPWLSAPLPPSRRRQTVCVLQIVALILSLMPVLEPAVSTPVAGLGLLLLVASFAIDTRWLAKARTK